MHRKKIARDVEVVVDDEVEDPSVQEWQGLLRVTTNEARRAARFGLGQQRNGGDVFEFSFQLAK